MAYEITIVKYLEHESTGTSYSRSYASSSVARQSLFDWASAAGWPGDSNYELEGVQNYSSWITWDGTYFNNLSSTSTNYFNINYKKKTQPPTPTYSGECSLKSVSFGFNADNPYQGSANITVSDKSSGSYKLVVSGYEKATVNNDGNYSIVLDNLYDGKTTSYYTVSLVAPNGTTVDTCTVYHQNKYTLSCIAKIDGQTDHISSASVSDSTPLYGGSVSFTAVVKTGHEFVGWYTSTTTSTRTSDKNPYTINSVTSNTTLYARGQTKKYSVYLDYYDSTSRSGLSLSGGSSSASYGSQLELIATPGDTYAFDGWWVYNDDGDLVRVSANQRYVITVTENQTYYAKAVKRTWNYYLRYNANGGSGGPANPESALNQTSTSYVFTVSSVKPTRNNYAFLGWDFDSSATIPTYPSGSSNSVTLYNTNPDRTLYAVWARIYTYSYRYNANTTDTVTNMPEDQSASSSETTYSFDIRGNVPSRTGYTFQGWALVSSGGGSIYSPNDPGPQLNTNKTSITLYAQWSPRNYTITVDHYDDVSSDGLYISGGGSYQYGSVATITATPRTGYTFDGWYTYISGVLTRVSGNQNYDVTVTGATTYYAKANKIAPTIPTATIEITGATSSSLSVKATLTNVLTFSDRWYLCISATGVFEAGTYTAIEASEQPFSYTFTGLSANTTYYFKVMNFYNGQYGWQVQTATGTTLRNTFSWDFNNNLDNRRPTANEWVRLISFVEQKFGKPVSQRAKDSVFVGGTLSAELFNELASDIGYASTVGRGTPISRAILYNLQNEANRQL